MNRKRYLGINTYIILIVASLLFSTAAHSIPSLSEGLDWELDNIRKRSHAWHRD